MDVKYKNLQTTTLAYAVYGTGRISLVVEMGLGAVMGEWNTIAGELAKKHTVLLYERAGYGNSDESILPRTPQNIAMELKYLLDALDCEEQITILAHSQGGLYAQCFARMYSEKVKKLVLLDPLSANDNVFRQELSKKEFKKSGVDKTAGLRINRRLAKLHMGGIIRSMMCQAPPFYYYDRFSQEEREYILSSLTKPALYETALQEYQIAHDDRIVTELKSRYRFPACELVLITHNSRIAEKEIMEFGKAQKEEAEKIERLWQKLMQEYLRFTDHAQFVQAEHSSHYIHLMDMPLLQKYV